MDAISLIIGLVIGILSGVIIGLILWRGKEAPTAPQFPIDLGVIESAVKAAASDAVKTNREETVKLAKDQINPMISDASTKIQEAKTGIESKVEILNNYLKSIEGALNEIEIERGKAFSSLHEQITALMNNEKELRDSAIQLSNAIKNPQTVGSWGEITLKRIAELSGMVEYCDFDTQVSIMVDGEKRRPDMVVKLSSNRVIIVDSKVPLSSYLQAQEAKTQEEYAELMKDHAERVKGYANDLSKKEYWKGFNAKFNGSLELVVMFIPGESFLQAAVQKDRELIERAMESNVIIATPTILLSLLKATARGWNEKKVEENAKEILKLGKDLYDRLQKISDEISDLGGNIEKAVKSYNTLIGTYENRVIKSAKKLSELGVGDGKEMESLNDVETSLRKLKPHDQNNSAE
ncbi:MAG: DNA recombination protein RmuC [Thermoplasmatales archaeon]|nr:DNA recombination protein RmuC [Thermoplasmatales archaeon]